MSHLTDEQFEDIIQGVMVKPEHFNQCDQCKKKLAEKQALAVRLRSAFAAVKPSENLAERINQRLNTSSTQRTNIRQLLGFRRHWRGWLAVASSAAALIILVPFVIYMTKPSAVDAAQAELARIHHHNLSANNEFYSQADPEKLAEYFKDKLGFSPTMPQPGQGLALRGCCVRHFRGKIVGSYVVETPEGIMSIVVVTDHPQTLGMGQKFQHSQYTFWKSSFARCKMVTVQLGDYSYCVVGEISHSYLIALLDKLLPDSEQ